MRIFILFFALFSISLAQDSNSLELINKDIKNNIWRLKFINYLNYEELNLSIARAKKDLKNCDNEEEKNRLNKEIQNLSEQRDLLKKYEKSPYLDIITEPNFKTLQNVDNPFAILFGYSSIKNLTNLKKDYKDKLNSLDFLISKLDQKRAILLANCKKCDSNSTILKLNYEIGEFKNIKELSKVLINVYDEKIDEQIAIIKSNILEQGKRSLNIAITIVVIILLSYLIKKIIKRYMVKNENLYQINKLINFLNFLIIALILLFSYIENMSYFITIFGFVSAGIAIAMKDMLTSLLAWMIIVSTGSFRVGDRVKVVTRKMTDEYVGDIIDISPLKMTIYEDITYTTYKNTRRAGRIIFVPNNYIFTELLANYTHGGMKTVWDGIDITLTYDSNYKKAIYIIKNIVLQYSRGYTDIARKQMRTLRTNYSVKKPNVDPVIYNFFESYGINLSIWYMTSAYAVLSLRSNISAEILEAFKKEPDIQIAYPSRIVIHGEIGDMEPYKKSSDKEKIVYWKYL